MIAAIDYETYYDSECTIVELGIYHYLRHPKSDIYMVSIATDTGIRYVGHPKDFDWTSISGPEWTWLSHNAQFDYPVFVRTQELGIGNTCEVKELAAWHDTADLTAFLSYPRSLKDASKFLLGVELSKDVRDKMKGQRWELMTPEFKKEVEKYALDDAVYCLEIFLQHGHKWPEHEREISRMTREMALRGVPVDIQGLEEAAETLKLAIWEAKQVIPWAEDHPILSLPAARTQCEKDGIEAPVSFAQNDPEAEAWEAKYSEQFPWIKAMRSYRKANKHLSTVETMLKRAQSNGWMSYGLKYYGAHTGRDSGDSGWNAQNLPKGEVCGVDVRSKVKAPEGYTLAIVDLSQIEPRVLHWLAKDEETLQYIREIPDLYEAFARAWGLYTDERPLKEVDQKLRHATKTMALGLQYGMGANKFSAVAGIEAGEANRLVKLYRSKNKKVTKLWKDLEEVLRKTAIRGEGNATVDLPSGRSLTYRNVTIDGDSLTAIIPRLGKLLPLKFWGGILTENAVQAMARCVFMDRCLEIEKLGIQIVMRVHDEVVCVVPEATAESDLNAIISVMSTAPTWAPGLPLAAEGGLSKVYKK